MGDAGKAIGNAYLQIYAGPSYLYTKLWYETVFPHVVTRGPVLKDLRFNGVDQGEPLPRLYGKSVRVEGQLIFVGDLIRTNNSHSQNGKAGSGGEFVETTYSVHCAVAFGEAPAGALRFKKLLANRKVIFDADADVDETSDQFVGTTSVTTYYATDTSGNFVLKHRYYLKITSPDGDADLSQARVNKALSVSGGPAGNDGSWTVTDSKKNEDGTSYVKVVRLEVDGFGAFTTFTAGSFTVNLLQHLPTFSQKTMDEAPHVYLGSQDQPIDSFTETLAGGVGSWSALPGVVWCALKNLHLIDYGNGLPQFEAEIECESLLADNIVAACGKSGLDASEVDVSTLTDELSGYVARGVSTGLQDLTPLMAAYELETYETLDIVHFVKRSSLTALDVSASLLAAHADGEQPARVVEVRDDAVDKVPTHVTLRFVDPTREDQTGSEEALSFVADRRVVEVVDLPVSLDATYARGLADRMLRSARAWSRGLTVQLPPSLSPDVREGMTLSFDAYGRTWDLLTKRVDVGDDHRLVVEGFAHQPHLFADTLGDTSTDSEPAGLGSGTQHQTFTSSLVELHLLDVPALSDEYLRAPVLFAAACLTSPGEKFTTVLLHESVDGGESYRRVATLTTSAVIGSTLNALPDGEPDTWDETSTMDVELSGDDELAAVSKLQCLNGENRAVVGLEIVGFRDVELVAERTYRLSGLLRGLRGTLTTGHVVGDRFVVLTAPGIVAVPLQAASLGVARTYKATTSGALLDEAEALETVPLGINVWPFAPCHVKVARDASDNATVSWTRRTRANVRLLSAYQGTPLVDPEESYEVDVYDGVDVVRTIRTAEPSCEYSAAQQTADGLTPGADLSLAVYQVGDLVRRGFGTTVTA